MELLAHSNRAETLYMAIDGKVFDITQFVAKHPEATYSATFQALRTSGKLVFDAEYRFGRKIDLDAALIKFEGVATSGSVASVS